MQTVRSEEDKGPVTTVRRGAARVPIYKINVKGRGEYFLAKWTRRGKMVRILRKDLDALRAIVRKRLTADDAEVPDLDTLDDSQLAVIREVIRRGVTLSDLERLATAPAPIHS